MSASGVRARRAGMVSHTAEGRAAVGLALRGVGFAYGRRAVLRGASLSVDRGSLLALVGPNGAGKSTLLRLIAGALEPGQGAIEVLGANIAALPPRERARLVALVPQNPQLPPGASVLEIVLLGRNPHLRLLGWESAADVDAAVRAARLTAAHDLLDRSIDELSGGERQRAAIALALAQETPLLLLDEPTANLDLAHQSSIMSLLRRLTDAGATVVIAVHDLTLAAQFADTAALLHAGRILAAGPARGVLTPDNIRRAYGAEVQLVDHPDTGKPVIVNAWRRTDS